GGPPHHPEPSAFPGRKRRVHNLLTRPGLMAQTRQLRPRLVDLIQPAEALGDGDTDPRHRCSTRRGATDLEGLRHPGRHAAADLLASLRCTSTSPGELLIELLLEIFRRGDHAHETDAEFYCA